MSKLEFTNRYLSYGVGKDIERVKSELKEFIKKEETKNV